MANAVKRLVIAPQSAGFGFSAADMREMVTRNAREAERTGMRRSRRWPVADRNGDRDPSLARRSLGI
jgi:hypothetical protein